MGQELGERMTRLHVHLFFGAWVVLGGVTGRPEFTPPYWYFAFFSEGFKIFKHRHSFVSISTEPAKPVRVHNVRRYLEGTHERFIDTHHAACVVELPAVIWSGEQCDQLAFGKEFVSILHNLRGYMRHYCTAYSDRYQDTELQLDLQSHADVYCTKQPTVE